MGTRLPMRTGTMCEIGAYAIRRYSSSLSEKTARLDRNTVETFTHLDAKRESVLSIDVAGSMTFVKPWIEINHPFGCIFHPTHQQGLTNNDTSHNFELLTESRNVSTTIYQGFRVYFPVARVS